MTPSLVSLLALMSSSAWAQTFADITDDGIVVPLGDPGDYHEYNVGSPSVVWNPDANGGTGEFVMYFEYRGAWGSPARCAGGAGTEWGIGRATSDDGVSWTVADTAALHPFEDTFWECALVHPNVVYEGPGKWHMYFKAWQESGKVCDGADDPEWGCDLVTGVGYASSSDGITWSVPSTTPIVTVDDDPTPEDFGWPRVVQVSGTWLMFMNYGNNGITVATAQDPEGPWTWEGYTAGEGRDEVLTPDTTLPWQEDELLVADVSCNDEDPVDSPPMFNMFFGAHDRYNPADGEDPQLFWTTTPNSRAFAFADGDDVDTWTHDTTPEIEWTQAEISDNTAWRSWTSVPVDDGDYIIYYQRFIPGEGNQVGLAYTSADTSWDLATVQGDICTYLGAAPDGGADEFTATEETELAVAAPGVMDNDVDPERNAFTVALGTDASHGELTFSADGSFTYLPELDFSGTDSFTYTASDGQTVSEPVTVTLTVENVQDVPVAADDSFTTDEDTVLAVDFATGVLANDADADNDPLTAVLVQGPASGTLKLQGDGSFTYTPAENDFGAESFTYMANDGLDNSSVRTVTLNISPVNDAPVALDDAYAGVEDTVVVADKGTSLLANDSDVENDALTAVLVKGPASGTVELKGDGTFAYTPASNFFGEDTFTYRATDGVDDSEIRTATITIAAVNDIPDAADDTYTGDEDIPLMADKAAGVLANDVDVENDALTAVLVKTTTSGTLTLESDGSFVYEPDADFFGVDTFTYVANDGLGDSEVRTVTLDIAGENDLPVATDDAYTTPEDATLVVRGQGVLENDTDVEGGPLTVTVVDDVTSGTLTANPDGTFDYVPDADFHGTDGFTYTVSDGEDSSRTAATVTITVSSVDDAPVAEDESYEGTENVTLSVDASRGLLVNDADADGDTLTAELVDDVSNGTLTLADNGGFQYVPHEGFSGMDWFTYVATDGTLTSQETTVRLTIAAVDGGGGCGCQTSSPWGAPLAAPALLGLVALARRRRD